MVSVIGDFLLVAQNPIFENQFQLPFENMLLFKFFWVRRILSFRKKIQNAPLAVYNTTQGVSEN